ncbi:hypothetical protein Pelo_5102 [Pelomyxa schiedti]|nr:hypothetical protein Pelo_5102 [Pelomyxa schiedti]
MSGAPQTPPQSSSSSAGVAVDAPAYAPWKFFEAAENGDAATLDRMLREGTNPDAQQMGSRDTKHQHATHYHSLIHGNYEPIVFETGWGM